MWPKIFDFAKCLSFLFSFIHGNSYLFRLFAFDMRSRRVDARISVWMQISAQNELCRAVFGVDTGYVFRNKIYHTATPHSPQQKLLVTGLYRHWILWNRQYQVLFLRSVGDLIANTLFSLWLNIAAGFILCRRQWRKLNHCVFANLSMSANSAICNVCLA